MLWLCWKQINGNHNHEATIYPRENLEHILPIKKLLKRKKVLESMYILPIISKHALYHNSHLPIFVLPKILKIRFSRIKISITNDNYFSNKTWMD